MIEAFAGLALTTTAEFLKANCFTQSFAAGLLGNLLASAGYDLGKTGAGNLSQRLRDIWREGGVWRNHDLLRAVRRAECEAMIALCDVCLLEDYAMEPNLARAFGAALTSWGNTSLAGVRQDWHTLYVYITNQEARFILALREDFRELARRVDALTADELEQQAALCLDDVDELARAGREIGAAQSADELRQRATEKFVETLAQSCRRAEPEGFTASLRRRVREWLGFQTGGQPHFQTGAWPDSLQQRLTANWFDFLRLAFREILKSDAGAAARRAFEVDVLAKLEGNAPRRWDEIETKLAQFDGKLDKLGGELKGLRRDFQDNAEAWRRDWAAWERRFARWQQSVRDADADWRAETRERLARLQTGVDSANTKLNQQAATLNRIELTLEEELRRSKPADTGGPEPAPPEPLGVVGRDELVGQLAERMRAAPGRIIPLVGQAGIGKTTASLKAFYRQDIEQHFGERRYFVRCETLARGSDVAFAVAAQLGLAPSTQPLAGVLAHLREGPALIILDNFETPLQAADGGPARETARQLAAVAGVAVAASLRPVELPGGAEVWEKEIEPQPLTRDEARAVFLDKSGGAGEPAEVLEQLLAAMDGLPLALALMANAARQEGGDLAAVWRRWERAKTKMLSNGIDPRNRNFNLDVSLQATVDGPLLQDGRARRFMSVLALLPDGVAGEDWPALAPDGDEEAARAVRQARLAFPAGGRLQMLNPVREFVQSHYPPDEADAARAAAHYVGLANECGWIETNIGRMFNGQTAMPRFRPDAANLETMILRSLAGGLSSANLTAANALAEFGSYSGLPLDAPLRRAAELCGEDRQWQLEKANCVKRLGDIALRRSDHDAARKLYEQAQPLYAQVGDVLGQANCVQSLGDIALRRSDHDAARKLYEQAQPLYVQVGSVLGQANCVQSLGDIEREAGRGAAARGLYHDALTQYRRIQEPYSIGVTFYRLAQVADDDTERARCVNEARAAWLSIKREDLVEILDKEFGEGI